MNKGIVAVFIAFLLVMLPVCFAQTLNIVYDNNGNLVTGDGYFRMYDSENKLWKVFNGSSTNGILLEEYTYDLVEERVLMKKSYNLSGNWTETVIYVNQNYVRVKNSSGAFDTTYVYHEGQLVAQRNSDGTKIFYHPDHLGSTTLITDQSGNLVENTFYSPFGKILNGGNSRFDYTGQEYDSVIGDYDYHARRYKADWGKFLQPDILVKDIYNPQELNRYAYAMNNPWRYKDETGHVWQAVVYRLTELIIEVGTVLYGISESKKIYDKTRNNRDIYEGNAMHADIERNNIPKENAMHDASTAKNFISSINLETITVDFKRENPKGTTTVIYQKQVELDFSKKTETNQKSSIKTITINENKDTSNNKKTTSSNSPGKVLSKSDVKNSINKRWTR